MRSLWWLIAPLLLWPWYGYYKFPIHNAFTLSSAVTANLLVLSLGLLLTHFHATWLVLSPFSRRCFSIVAIFYACLVALVYPGWIGIDAHFLTNNLAKGAPTSWGSLTYSLVVLANYYLTGTVYGVILFQYIIFLFIAIEGFSWLQQSGTQRWRPLGFLVVLLLPLSQIFVAYQMRDALFSAILVSLIVSVLRRSRSQQISKAFVISFALITALLYDLRQDGKLILGMVCLLPLFWPALRTRAQLLVFYPTMIVCILFYVVIASKVYHYDPTTPGYKLTIIGPPVGEILTVLGPAALSPEQRKIVDDTFGIDLILKSHDRYSAFYHDKVSKDRLTNFKNTYSEFERVAFDLIKKYPGIYLKWRRDLALRISNMDPKGPAALMSGFYESLPWEAFDVGTAMFSKFQPPNAISDKYMRYVNWLFRDSPYFMRLSLFSLFFPLIFLILAMLSWRTEPLLAWCAITIIVRLSGVLAFATMAYFNYLFAIWLAGWILLFGLKFNTNPKATKTSESY